MSLVSITGGGGKSEREINDFYPTPTATTQSLVKYLPISKEDILLEPSAGQGHISNVLQNSFPSNKIISTDLIDYGNPNIQSGLDFLVESYPYNKADWVITNPPYSSKILMPFVLKALQIASKGVAMLLKITFLESVRRKKFFEETQMLENVVLFSNRQPMYKNGIVTKASNAICYAWYIWNKDFQGNPTILWEDNSNEVKSNLIKGIY